jgi:hypothetical protein
MIWIDRPKGSDLSDTRVELTFKDENALRAATVVITPQMVNGNDAIRIRVSSPTTGETNLVIEL